HAVPSANCNARPAKPRNPIRDRSTMPVGSAARRSSGSGLDACPALSAGRSSAVAHGCYVCFVAAGNRLVPPYNELLWPTLIALHSLGSTARLEEIDEKVIDQQGFTEAQLAVLHNGGPRSEIEYRLAWARTYLKGMGLDPQRLARRVGDHARWSAREGEEHRAALAGISGETARAAAKAQARSGCRRRRSRHGCVG